MTMSTDPLSQLLLRQGYRVEPETLGGSTLLLGMKVVWHNSVITYKAQGDTVTIISYERINPSRGLANGFRDLLRWFALIKAELPEIIYLVGKVDALPDARLSQPLSDQKLHRFYRDILQAPLAPDLGEAWYRWQIKNLVSFRQHYRKMKAKA